MSEPTPGLEPIQSILPRVLARIPGMGAYLRKQEEAEKDMTVTDLDRWFEDEGEDAA
jgi:hypothetical protein